MSETPITDEWLSAVDFKWWQGERQPNKHYTLICNVIGQTSRCIEPTAIEVQRCGWIGGHGDYIGDPSRWMLWIKDRFDRSVFLREIQWQEEIVLLAELITGRAWNPDTHIYGQAWPAGSRALVEKRQNVGEGLGDG